MRIMIIFFISFSIMIFQCNNEKRPLLLQKQILNDSINTIVKEWRIDSLGCLNLRTIEKANTLFKVLQFNKKKGKEIIEILGSPNYISNYGPNFCYSYIFNALCYNNKLIDSADYCWIDFLFNSNDSILISMLPICI